MSSVRKFCIALLAAMGLSPAAAQSERQPEYIVVRSSDRSVAQVIEAIEAHVKAKKYQAFSVTTVKPPQGEVAMVKFCVPAVGRQLWAVDLKLSAMLPCGNIGVYARDGKTEIAMLRPGYMAALHPDAAVAKAAETAEPLFAELLDRAVSDGRH